MKENFSKEGIIGKLKRLIMFDTISKLFPHKTDVSLKKKILNIYFITLIRFVSASYHDMMTNFDVSI
jgi:flagellar biosynthesis protein FlhB